jgi:hypothetical protein
MEGGALMTSRRASILLSVLVVVALAALIGATAMYTARAQAATASVTLRRTQARALVWSGVQAVMAELAEQRDAMLDGETPRVTEEWELFEDGEHRAVVRLLHLSDAGDHIQSESARINLNTAPAPMLEAMGLSAEVAAAVVTARDQRAFASVEELLEVPGFPARLLHPTSDTDESSTEDHTPLADLLTVWSFDPNVQSGLGEGAGRHRGNLRVNLDVPWSERLAGAVDDRFGDGASKVLKSLMDQGSTFKSMGDLIKALQGLRIEPKDWGPILDAFTMSDDPYLPGKIDLSQAPKEVLACIPGFDAGIAEKAVQARAGMDPDARKSIAWPLLQGLMTPEQFILAADHLTTRSTQWRVRIEAGIATGQGDSAVRDAGLRDRIVYEAVIDVASERPQVAYLRDITMLDAAQRLARTLRAEAGESEDDPASDLDLLLPRENEEDLDQAPATGSGRLKGPVPGLGMPGLGPRRGLVGGGLSLDTDLKLSSPESSFGDLDLGIDEDGDTPVVMGPPEVEEEAPEPAPGAGVDRRIGRWTAGQKGGAK